jgi:hypothetical protein
MVWSTQSMDARVDGVFQTNFGTKSTMDLRPTIIATKIRDILCATIRVPFGAVDWIEGKHGAISNTVKKMQGGYLEPKSKSDAKGKSLRSH